MARWDFRADHGWVRQVGGKPCIRGVGFTVRQVLELLATYPDQAALVSEYPFLEPEDLQEVLRYTVGTVEDEFMDLQRVA